MKLETFGGLAFLAAVAIFATAIALREEREPLDPKVVCSHHNKCREGMELMGWQAE